MSVSLKINVRGADRLIAFFKTVPTTAKPMALNTFMNYVVGNPTRGLQHYPPYESPTYRRTYRLQASWYISPATESHGYIATQVPYAIYPMGNPPTHVMRRIGWRSALDVVYSNMTGGIRAASQAVIRWMKANV